MENKEKEFPRGQLNPTILSTLLDKDKYGYEIIDDIKNKTGIEIKQPSLYSSLKRMETQKLISSYWQDSDIGGKRHYYCLTGIGKEFLEKNPVDLSLFEPKNENVLIENQIKDKIQEIDEKIQNEIKSYESEQPKIAQQDNIFNIIKEEVVKNEEEIEEQEDKDFVQYDLFKNIKPVEDVKNEANSKRIIHNKSSNDPYQLKYLSEDELKNEFERIKNQKLGIISEPTKANVWLDRNNYMETEQPKVEKQVEEAQHEVNHKEIVQETYNEEEKIKETYSKIEEKKVESQKDDAIFITERINIDELPKTKIAPANLNIESNNYSTFLNSKIASREPIGEDKEGKERYQQRIAQMFTKKTDEVKFDYNKSLDNLENKFEKHLNKNQVQEYREPDKNFSKVENTYERINNNSLVFNSYKGLESYYNSKGIGFYIYNKKEKSANQYVDYSLIKLTRGIIFSLYSIILALSFYLGIRAQSIGKITYIILPILILGLTIVYAISYHKSKSNTIIKVEEKDSIAPVILPLISACAILVIIAINLIIGFHDGNALYYFPLLIYPMCLALHIAIITPLNKLIKILILKYRSIFKNRKK